MEEEKRYRSRFNAITLINVTLVLISLSLSNTVIIDLLLFISFFGSCISLIYACEAFLLRPKRTGKTRFYDSILSSKFISILSLICYAIVFIIILFILILIAIGYPGPGPVI